MKNFQFISLLAAFILFSAFTATTVTSWNIDSKYSIKFNTKKAKGTFKQFSGDILFDENNIEDSKFDVSIDVKSIKTGFFLKNSHAKGEQWFDADQYPTINFTSQSFEKTNGSYMVTGILAMKGVTKEITMPFTFLDNVFKSSFTVNRTDFNIGKTTGMSAKVGHEITIDISVPVTK